MLNQRPEFAVIRFNFTLCEIEPVKIETHGSWHLTSYLGKRNDDLCVFCVYYTSIGSIWISKRRKNTKLVHFWNKKIIVENNFKSIIFFFKKYVFFSSASVMFSFKNGFFVVKKKYLSYFVIFVCIDSKDTSLVLDLVLTFFFRCGGGTCVSCTLSR